MPEISFDFDNTLARPVDGLTGVIADAKAVDAFATRIRESLGRTSENVIATAALVSAARNALDHKGYRELSKKVGMSPATLNKFVTIHSRRDRFSGRESLMPHSWTVAYAVQSLPDVHFETLERSGMLGSELTEKDVKKLVAGREAAAVSTRKASDELAYLSVAVTFAALLSLEREDHIRKDIFELFENQPDVAVKISQRRKVRAKRAKFA